MLKHVPYKKCSPYTAEGLKVYTFQFVDGCQTGKQRALCFHYSATLNTYWASRLSLLYRPFGPKL
jgi:hypothetical protein